MIMEAEKKLDPTLITSFDIFSCFIVHSHRHPYFDNTYHMNMLFFHYQTLRNLMLTTGHFNNFIHMCIHLIGIWLLHKTLKELLHLNQPAASLFITPPSIFYFLETIALSTECQTFMIKTWLRLDKYLMMCHRLCL